MNWVTPDSQYSAFDWVDWSEGSFDAEDFAFISWILTGSEIIAETQEDDKDAADYALESHMNAAGRSAMHPFRDFRSAAHARQRSRKYANDHKRNSGACHSVACRKWSQSAQRLKNKRKKRKIVWNEVSHSQERRPDFLFRYDPTEPRPIHLDWDIRQKSEYEEKAERMYEDLARCRKFHRNADVFGSEELYTECDELFLDWAQRRIMEMRVVKENRLRASEPAVQSAAVSETRKLSRPFSEEYNVYHGSSYTTTLPTNTHDAYGHALLNSALTPSKWLLRRAWLGPPIRLFPSIDDFSWFSKCAWQWHRNDSGCWEIGYWDDNSRDGDGGMVYGWWCCCGESMDEPAPDEVHCGSLLEWVGAEGRRLMMKDELEREREMEEEWQGEESYADSVCGSEWSVVDGESEATPSILMHMSRSSWSSSSPDLVVVEH